MKMRNAATPTSKNKSDNENEKNSGKKLVQARLPFKILTPGSTASEGETASTVANDDEQKTTNNSWDGRKRKLSYDSNEDDEIAEKARRSGSKENLKDIVPKKQKTFDDAAADDVVLLDDSSCDSNDDDNADEKEKEKPKLQKSSLVKTPNVRKSINNSEAAKEQKTKATPKQTPKNVKNQTEKRKSVGSANKLQIKLPVGNGKKTKKRKSMKKLNGDGDEHVQDSETAESSDDIEKLAGELNPQKKVKTDLKNEEKTEVVLLDSSDVNTEMSEEEKEKEPPAKVAKVTNKNEAKLKDNDEKNDSQLSQEKDTSKDTSKASSNVDVDADNDSKKKDKLKNPFILMGKSRSSLNSTPQIATVKDTKKTEDKAEEKETEKEDKVTKNSEDVEEMMNVTASGIEDNLSSDNDVQEKSENSDSSNKSSKNESFVQLSDTSLNKSKKNLTPKQEKFFMRRKKAREEKERKLAEEKRQKQIEKEEKELAKKREREEKEEQRKKEKEEKEEQRKREREEKEEQKRKEKEEKEEQRRKEREEKEKKRLAEIEAKNEEKRKRIEAKEEEIRKKDEDKKRKEMEKEEAKLKTKKAAEAFTKFFVAKPNNLNCTSEFDQTSNESSSVNEAVLAFRPFQVKGDMTLAPVFRKQLPVESKQKMDELLGLKPNNNEDDEDEEEIVCRKPLKKANLYLGELKAGKISPVKWKKQLREASSADDDVVLVEDEMEREGQEIIEECHPPVERFRAKFYRFYENRRPPYYGTWRKKSSKITARKPFSQDQKYFDYEVDSDLEWEEEEPGESLDGSDDEDKEKESEDEDYEVDNEWFVPHGHLSEEEMQNEDEIGGEDDTTREAQKAKLKLLQQEFAQEMKKKTEKIKPRLVGCIWVDENGNHPELCPQIIWDKLNRCAMQFTEPPLTEEPPNPERPEPSSPSTSAAGANEKVKTIAINDKLQKVLVRLLHGNTNSKAFLVKEFLAFVDANEDSVKNGDAKGPSKVSVKEKIDEFAEWKPMELENTLKKKSKKLKKYLCWVVNDEILEKMDLKDLDLKNEWQYLLTPKRKDPNLETSLIELNANGEAAAGGDSNESKQEEVEKKKDSQRKLQLLPNSLASKSKSNESHKSPKEQEKEKEKPDEEKKEQKNEAVGSSPAGPKKKRVPLLMSGARGQQFAAPAKNALISQFLKKSSEARESKDSKEEGDKAGDKGASADVIVLD